MQPSKNRKHSYGLIHWSRLCITTGGYWMMQMLIHNFLNITPNPYSICYNVSFTISFRYTDAHTQTSTLSLNRRDAYDWRKPIYGYYSIKLSNYLIDSNTKLETLQRFNSYATLGWDADKTYRRERERKCSHFSYRLRIRYVRHR